MHRVNDPLSLSLPVSFLLPLSSPSLSSLSEEWGVSFHLTTSVQGATAELVQEAE